MSKRIVLVGHCGPDTSMLKSALRSVAPEAVIAVADSEEELARLAPGSDLLLVNRVLDGDFGVSEGLELAGRHPGPAFMLVSDYAEAQARAEAAGARPGFGKRQLRSELMRSRVRAALGLDGASGER